MKTKMLFCTVVLPLLIFSFSFGDKSANVKYEGYLFTVSNQRLLTEIQSGFSNLVDEVGSIEVYDNKEFGMFYLVSGKKATKEVSFKLHVTKVEIETSTYSYISPEDLALARTQGSFEVYCYLILPSACSHLYPPSNPICGVKSQNCRFVD